MTGHETFVTYTCNEAFLIKCVLHQGGPTWGLRAACNPQALPCSPQAPKAISSTAAWKRGAWRAAAGAVYVADGDKYCSGLRNSRKEECGYFRGSLAYGQFVCNTPFIKTWAWSTYFMVVCVTLKEILSNGLRSTYLTMTRLS